MLYLYPMASHSDRTMVRWQDHESHQIPCQSGQADLYFHYADIEFWALFDSHSSYTPRSVFQDGPDRWPTFTLTHIATRTIECTTLMATNQRHHLTRHPNTSKPAMGQHQAGSRMRAIWHQRRQCSHSGDHRYARTDQRRIAYTQTTLPQDYVGSIRFHSGGFTLSWTLFSKFFATFPHGTCLLSNSYSYLALDDVYHPTLDCTFKQPDSKAQHKHRPREYSYGACTLWG